MPKTKHERVSKPSATNHTSFSELSPRTQFLNSIVHAELMYNRLKEHIESPCSDKSLNDKSYEDAGLQCEQDVKRCCLYGCLKEHALSPISDQNLNDKPNDINKNYTAPLFMGLGAPPRNADKKQQATTQKKKKPQCQKNHVM